MITAPLVRRKTRIHEEMLGQHEEAIATYREVLSNDPENKRALRSLDRLYVGSQSWEDLADNLGQQLALAETDHERTELLVRLAELRETRLEEPAAAVETYRQVLELDPHSDEAVTALERLSASEEHELQIAQILEPIYRARGDWAEPQRASSTRFLPLDLARSSAASAAPISASTSAWDEACRARPTEQVMTRD